MPKKVADEIESFEEFLPKTKAKIPTRPKIKGVEPPATGTTKAGDELEGRCMKCSAQRPFIVKEFKDMRGGTRMAKGSCTICGTTICKILGKGK